MTLPGIISTGEAHVAELRDGMRWVTTEAAMFRVEGTGAVDCLQGLLTCDIVGPGSDSVTYGAMLTAKGMITVDFLVFRDGAGFTLIADPAARLPALDLFKRQLPPRFARASDRSDSHRVLWLLGAKTETVVRGADLPWPEHAGRLIVLPSDRGPALLGRPPAPAPWNGILAGTPDGLAAIADRLTRAGGVEGTFDDLELARVLGGWPTLGREIDQRTLPQEVRYDAIGGVSYTKGCYVGQETVARVHFRGHVNRRLRGLLWQGPAPAETDVLQGDKPVGRLTSGVQLENRGVGLGLIRREVEPGATVRIGATAGVVVDLPFESGDREAPGMEPGASP